MDNPLSKVLFTMALETGLWNAFLQLLRCLIKQPAKENTDRQSCGKTWSICVAVWQKSSYMSSVGGVEAGQPLPFTSMVICPKHARSVDQSEVDGGISVRQGKKKYHLEGICSVTCTKHAKPCINAVGVLVCITDSDGIFSKREMKSITKTGRGLRAPWFSLPCSSWSPRNIYTKTHLQFCFWICRQFKGFTSACALQKNLEHGRDDLTHRPYTGRTSK